VLSEHPKANLSAPAETQGDCAPEAVDPAMAVGARIGPVGRASRWKFAE
jgi:hypothetical protein